MIQPTLDANERRQIQSRLLLNLAGAGLLGLAFVLDALRGDNPQFTEAIKALAAAIVAVPVLWRGVKGLASRDPKSFTDQLVSLAVLAAAVSGDFVTATLVPLVLEIGRLFEERSALGARAAIAGVRKLRASQATRLDGSLVDPADLQAGDVVIVRPGEVIPADGTVHSGSSAVDQAPITGESRTEDVGSGDNVFAGTINLQGLLQVQVTGAGQDTVLGKVVALLQDLENAKVPALRLLERYSGAWLPVVLVLAASVLFFTEDVARAIAVLVVATPTALVLAGPAAMVATLAAATREQILIKDAGFLERVADVDTLLLDKTGTLTENRLRVVGIRPARGVDAERMLVQAAQVAAASRHPVSQALVRHAQEQGLVVQTPLESQEIPGKGVQVGTLSLGRSDWLQSLGAAHDPDPSGGVHLADGTHYLGSFEIADTVKREARAVLAQVREAGIERVVLVTGDRQNIAQAIADELGIEELHAQVLPEQKLDVVRAEQAKGRVVMMVGDGVNDALALSGADVGVAIGARVNEVALGGADVALLTEELNRLPRLLTLSAQSRAVMTQNAVLGVLFSVVMLALAAGGVISPLMGALLHNLGAIGVVLNSARLLSGGKEQPDPAGPRFGEE
jgi:heavy metal translocating P-type ATPase